MKSGLIRKCFQLRRCGVTALTSMVLNSTDFHFATAECSPFLGLLLYCAGFHNCIFWIVTYSKKQSICSMSLVVQTGALCHFYKCVFKTAGPSSVGTYGIMFPMNHLYQEIRRYLLDTTMFIYQLHDV